MPTDKQMLENFVHIGQDILSCNWATRYGHHIARVAPSPPGVGYAQPGFVGRDYRGLVVSRNPAVGTGRDEAHRLWDQAFRKWLDQGTVDAYLKVFQLWQRDFNEWGVEKYIKPILELRNFTEDHIGYLNLCKNATISNIEPTVRMYKSDWEWTERQLKLLQPRVVVAGGVEVDRQLKRFWTSRSCRVLTQNRIRSQSRAELDRQAKWLADEILKELQ